MNIVLTGYMGSGKTMVGKEIAKLTGRKFVDTDQLIEQNQEMSIAKIFEACGEDYFRKIEADEIEKISRLDAMVISTGGGAVLNTKSIALLKENGIIVNLDPELDVIKERLSSNDDTRPLLKDKNIDEIIEKFETRKPYYNNCDFKVKITLDKTFEDTAKEILELLEEEENI